MGDKIVKSKNLCCQPVVFPSLSLLNCLVCGKYGLCEKNELENSTKCPENTHSCVYSSCTEAGGTNFIIRNCGDVTKIEKEDICRLGVI